jgi:hypothetical protein
MSVLLDLHMKEAAIPHGILANKNHLAYDIRKIHVWWDDKWPNGAIQLEMSSREEFLGLLFVDITCLTLPIDDVMTSVAIGILDTSRVVNSPAPIRVQHPQYRTEVHSDGLSFWAQKLEVLQRN